MDWNVYDECRSCGGLAMIRTEPLTGREIQPQAKGWCRTCFESAVRQACKADDEPLEDALARVRARR